MEEKKTSAVPALCGGCQWCAHAPAAMANPYCSHPAAGGEDVQENEAPPHACPLRAGGAS
jgi:hypothetical protein